MFRQKIGVVKFVKIPNLVWKGKGRGKKYGTFQEHSECPVQDTRDIDKMVNMVIIWALISYHKIAYIST